MVQRVRTLSPTGLEHRGGDALVGDAPCWYGTRPRTDECNSTGMEEDQQWSTLAGSWLERRPVRRWSCREDSCGGRVGQRNSTNELHYLRLSGVSEGSQPYQLQDGP